jgi:hypothetical protein
MRDFAIEFCTRKPIYTFITYHDIRVILRSIRIEVDAVIEKKKRDV